LAAKRKRRGDRNLPELDETTKVIMKKQNTKASESMDILVENYVVKLIDSLIRHSLRLAKKYENRDKHISPELIFECAKELLIELIRSQAIQQGQESKQEIAQ